MVKNYFFFNYHSAISLGYHFESSGPSQARFLTYYFPGWMARLDGQPVEIAVEPESGLITVPVPAGATATLTGSLPIPTPVPPVEVAPNTVNIVVLGSDRRPDAKGEHIDELDIDPHQQGPGSRL